MKPTPEELERVVWLAKHRRPFDLVRRRAILAAWFKGYISFSLFFETPYYFWWEAEVELEGYAFLWKRNKR